MKDMHGTWFAEAINEVLVAKGWTQTEMAGHLGVNTYDVNRWLNGSMPKPERQPALLQKLGGDIERALPSWRPRPPGESNAPSNPGVLRAGDIVGQDGRVAWLPEGRRPASPLAVESAIAPERWALGTGPALLLRLSSEIGLWPAGSTVVARGWRAGARPPEGLFAAAARSDAWGPGESGWRLRRLLWSDRDGGAAHYAAMSLDPLRADAQALPADQVELGAIACGVIMPV